MRLMAATVAHKQENDMQDWRWMTAADLGRAIGAGQIDPVALTEVYLDAIDAHEFRDRIYARVMHDRARAEAKAASARAKAGMRRSALDGVPVSWKDLFDTAGVGTEAGTALMAGRVPDQDAEMLKAATAAGLVCLGKTHMSEIAFSGLGLNPITATPPCVNDHEAVPGGSSSGAATSVAFGLAAAGIGSDTGGSVRIPSAWNDLVGLKTTHGRLSLEGVVPLCLTFDTVGPLCRSVEDANLLLAVLEGGKPADLAGCSLEGLRFMVLDTIVFDEIRGAPRDAFEDAVNRLQAAGAQIEHRAFPALADAFAQAGNLYAADSYGWWRDLVEAHPEKMFPQILERVRGGKAVGGADYCAGWNLLRDIRKQYHAETAQFDAVIMPTAPIVPPNAERLLADDAYYKSENLLALRNTRVANLMDVCSVTLPTGVPSCGIMLNGQNRTEAALLRVAAAVEGALRSASSEYLHSCLD
ncbi:amidase family protein [Roseobacter sp. CCS2]|nr:amidase family protein [Roseobacter sp. CCS2]